MTKIMESNNCESLKLCTSQVHAATQVCKELMEADSREETIKCITSLLQMKEKALGVLSDHLQRYVCTLTQHGISYASVAVVADGYIKAIRTTSGQMVAFANELSKLTHNEDVAFAYSRISERVEREISDLISPYMEQKDKVLNSPDAATFIEVYQTWHDYTHKN